MPEEVENIFYYLKQWFNRWTLAIASVALGVISVGVSEFINPTIFLASLIKDLLTILGIALITSVVVGISIESHMSGVILEPWINLFSQETLGIIKSTILDVNKSFVFNRVDMTATLVKKDGKYLLEMTRKFIIFNTSRRNDKYTFTARTGTFFHKTPKEFSLTLDGISQKITTVVTTDPSGMTTRSLTYPVEFEGKSAHTIEITHEEDADYKDFKIFTVPLATEILELHFHHPTNIKVSIESSTRKHIPSQKLHPTTHEEFLLVQNLLPFQFILAEWKQI